MTCASCGKSIPGGTRYCIHCGAEQSVPTPIAAVAAAASISRTSSLKAANAAHVEPRQRPDAANQPTAIPAPQVADPDAASAGTSPAYLSGSRQQGVAVAMIAMIAFVAIAAAVFWWIRHGESNVADAPAGSAVREMPAGAVPMPSADSKDAAPDRSSTPIMQPDLPPADAAPSASDGPGARTSAPLPPAVDIKPLPPRPARPRIGERTPVGAHAEPDLAPPTIPTPPYAPPQAAAPTGRVAEPTASRWRRMSDEMSRCTREDFITRVVCGQRVRFRYCEGYWGKVAQCPASPVPERGQ